LRDFFLMGEWPSKGVTRDVPVPAPSMRDWSEDWLALAAGAAVSVLAHGSSSKAICDGTSRSVSPRPVPASAGRCAALLATYVFVLALM